MNNEAAISEYEEMRENLAKYGQNPGEVDKESGRGYSFDDKRITSYFNTDKTALIYSFYIQDHLTASLTLSVKASYLLMRLISERLMEIQNDLTRSDTVIDNSMGLVGGTNE